MSIIELFQHVGAENITFQNLGESLIRGNMNGKTANITFGTDRGTFQDMTINNKLVGLVVWLPKDKLPEIGKGTPK